MSVHATRKPRRITSRRDRRVRNSPVQRFPYSDDLRSRVADAIAQGGAYRAIADRFGLAPSTVIKWAKRLRETGSIAPAKFGGHLKCRLDAHRDFVLDRIETVPHLTLHGLKDLLAERGVTVSHDTVWRFLRREGLSFKKNAAGD
jgi:transposase